MSNDELTLLPVATLARLMRERQVSPVEVSQAFLQRIQTYDRKIKAFIEVRGEEALKDAARAEAELAARRWRGPLHGIPFAVKDIIQVEEMSTTAGSRILGQEKARRDSAVVEYLRRSGAICLGKLNLNEFAFGITGYNPHYGQVANPWHRQRMSGGSSSGSAAAVACRFAPLALGTDTGGSIRIPSSLCGVVGLKPTYGLVSRRGVLPLAWSLDHVGLLATYVEDVAVALGKMAGYDREDPASVKVPVPNYREDLLGDLTGVTIGLPTNFFFEDVRTDVREKVLAAVEGLATLGARVEELEIPGVVQADRAAFTVLFSEAAASLGPYGRRHADTMDADVVANIETGLAIPAHAYIQALRVRRKLVAELADIFARVDVLAVPATCVDAPPAGATAVEVARGKEVDVRTALTRFTRYFNLAGNPVLTVPCGFSAQGRPVGIQLVGKPFTEATILRVGYAYQSTFPLEPALPELDANRPGTKQPQQ